MKTTASGFNSARGKGARTTWSARPRGGGGAAEQGDEADEIAQDGADKPAEANEYAIQKHGWNLFSRLFFVAGKGTRNLKSIPRSVASGKRNLDAVFFLRFLAKLSRHTNQAFSIHHVW